MHPLANAPDFTVLHGADMPSSTHASPRSSPAQRARTPRCVQHAPSRDDRASVYTSYTSLARHAGNARHAKGGKCCHSPPPRALRTLPRSSRERLHFLYFTRQPTGNARHAKGGKCRHSPPLRALRILPRSSPQRLHFLYFTRQPTGNARHTKGGKWP